MVVRGSLYVYLLLELEQVIHAFSNYIFLGLYLLASLNEGYDIFILCYFGCPYIIISDFENSLT